MSHQHCLVDLRLSEPAGLLTGEEDLDGHLLATPAAQPHLAVGPLPDLTHHLDLLGDSPLDLWRMSIMVIVKHVHNKTHQGKKWFYQQGEP